MTRGNGDQMESEKGSAEDECMLWNEAQMVHLFQEGCSNGQSFPFFLGTVF